MAERCDCNLGCLKATGHLPTGVSCAVTEKPTYHWRAKGRGVSRWKYATKEEAAFNMDVHPDDIVGPEKDIYT